jgi:hypothetical protein
MPRLQMRRCAMCALGWPATQFACVDSFLPSAASIIRGLERRQSAEQQRTGRASRQKGAALRTVTPAPLPLRRICRHRRHGANCAAPIPQALVAALPRLRVAPCLQPRRWRAGHGHPLPSDWVQELQDHTVEEVGAAVARQRPPGILRGPAAARGAAGCRCRDAASAVQRVPHLRERAEGAPRSRRIRRQATLRAGSPPHPALLRPLPPSLSRCPSAPACLPASLGALAFLPAFLCSHQRMPHRRHVDADLVGPAREDLHIHQGRTSPWVTQHDCVGAACWPPTDRVGGVQAAAHARVLQPADGYCHLALRAAREGASVRPWAHGSLPESAVRYQHAPQPLAYNGQAERERLASSSSTSPETRAR